MKKALPHTLGALYRALIDVLQEGGIDTPELEARIILQHRLDARWSDVIAHSEREISADSLSLITKDIKRRLAHEPLSRIYGEREFWGLRFKLSPDTLDPRPDTETLIDAVLKAYGGNTPATLLDLGTGSGCILLSLLREYPAARGVGVDISAGALDAARENAAHLSLSDRADFCEGSWWEALKGADVPKSYDLIVSNPPYISNQIIPNLDPEVRNHDPILALDGGNDGLDEYKKIFSELFSHLNPCGKAFFEIGFDQEETVVRLAEESRFFVKGVHRDLSGHARVVEISRGDK